MDARSYITEDGGRLNAYAVEPKMYVDPTGERGMFTPSAERVNGRFAMIGFVALLLTEALSGHTLIDIVTSL